MKIFIVFLAVLAVWCAVSATANFAEGDEFWGWLCTICLAINLVHLAVQVAFLDTRK